MLQFCLEGAVLPRGLANYKCRHTQMGYTQTSVGMLPDQAGGYGVHTWESRSLRAAAFSFSSASRAVFSSLSIFCSRATCQ